MGLTYKFASKERGWSTDRHIIDVDERSHVRRLCQPCVNCDGGYFAAVEPKPEVQEWLDRNTPGWRFFAFKVIYQFVFENKEHAMLFKLVWA